MVQYHNFSEVAGLTDKMAFWEWLSSQTNYIGFPLFFLGVAFIIPTMLMIHRGKDITMSIHYSSLFTSILAIIFYVSGILLNSTFIVIPILIYVVTLSMRWYNKDR